MGGIDPYYRSADDRLGVCCFRRVLDFSLSWLRCSARQNADGGPQRPTSLEHQPADLGFCPGCPASYRCPPSFANVQMVEDFQRIEHLAWPPKTRLSFQTWWIGDYFLPRLEEKRWYVESVKPACQLSATFWAVRFAARIVGTRISIRLGRKRHRNYLVHKMT